MLSAIDGARPPERRLSPQTVLLLAQNFARYGNQYLTFSEFGGLNDDSITRFLQVAAVIDRVSNVTLRANALGIFQANVGLWQILARQGQISAANLNPILAGGDRSFRGRGPLFDATFRLRPDLVTGTVAGGRRPSQSFP